MQVSSAVSSAGQWHTTINGVLYVYSLVPRPTPFFLFFGLNDTRLSTFFAAVYYCQRKPKNRKNGVGLGTRLYMYATVTSM